MPRFIPQLDTTLAIFSLHHSSGDTPLLVGHLQISPTNYYTLIEIFLDKWLQRLPKL